MNVYLVGGAVRDSLLELPVSERDWVVVGATPAQMTDQGFVQVGRDFPVFLHPKTKDEYALARTERKRGHGHRGFVVHCDTEVTLEEDLLRRDLTINAMAQDAAGNLIDPHGGQQDLQQKVLRHVSEAFVEDPLRVLRTARFAARFASLGFTVAPETLTLMTEIVQQGEMEHLSEERIWVELDKALATQRPDVFVQVLRDCGALHALLPEVDALFGVPQPTKHHPEVDTGVHLLMALQQAALMDCDRETRFAVLLHDLGKATTPADVLPRHIGHEARSAKLAMNVCARLKAPVRYRELAVAVGKYHTLCHTAPELRGKTLLKLLSDTDALRRPERFEQFLQACEADARGRLGLEQRDYPQAQYLREALNIARNVQAADFADQGVSGRALGEAIARERIKRLEAARRSQ